MESMNFSRGVPGTARSLKLFTSRIGPCAKMIFLRTSFGNNGTKSCTSEPTKRGRFSNKVGPANPGYNTVVFAEVAESAFRNLASEPKNFAPVKSFKEMIDTRRSFFKDRALATILYQTKTEAVVMMSDLSENR